MAPPAPACTITGKIISQTERIEPGRGLSDGQQFTYIDLETLVISQEYQSDGGRQLAESQSGGVDCKNTPGSTAVFQLQTGNQTLMQWLFGYDLAGKCIRGSSQYFGDGNFRSGNWLTVAEELPESACVLTAE